MNIFVFNRNYDMALRLMKRATAIPSKKAGINYHDEVSSSILTSNNIRYRRLPILLKYYAADGAITNKFLFVINVHYI